MEKALGPFALPAQETLFWVRELQRNEVVLQNKQNQDPDAMHVGLIGAMQTKLVDYTSYVKARTSQKVNFNLY